MGLSVKAWARYGKIVRSVVWNSKNKNFSDQSQIWMNTLVGVAGIRDSWVKIWGNTYDLCRMNCELTEQGVWHCDKAIWVENVVWENILCGFY